MPQVKGRGRVQVGVLITSFPHQIRQTQPSSAELLQPGEVKDSSPYKQWNTLQTLLFPSLHGKSQLKGWRNSYGYPRYSQNIKVVSNISPSLFPHSQHDFKLRPLHLKVYFLELQVIRIKESALCFIFQGIQRRSENLLGCHCCKTGHKRAPSTHGNRFHYVWTPFFLTEGEKTLRTGFCLVILVIEYKWDILYILV